MIAPSAAQHVVLSYYGGRNHWNHWSATDKPTDRGLKEVSALFKDKQFFDECEIVPALSVRQNYQSRVGERKQLVNEYLLLGSRTKIPSAGSEPLPALPANERLNIATHFSHFTTTRQLVTNKKSASGSSRRSLRTPTPDRASRLQREEKRTRSALDPDEAAKESGLPSNGSRNAFLSRLCVGSSIDCA